MNPVHAISSTIACGGAPIRALRERFRPGSAATGRLVVIGNGMVSHHLCQRVTDPGFPRPASITVIGEEIQPAYDRIHLSRYLDGATPAELSLAPSGWYRERGIELHTGDAAIRVDRDLRLVTTRSGALIPYDTLVFATGSEPFVPDIPGVRDRHVFTYRRFADLDAIRAAAATSRRTAVIGAGLLGLEAASFLRNLGLELHIIENGNAPLRRQLPEPASVLLGARLTELGYHLHTHKVTASIADDGAAKRLEFVDGSDLTADLVVIATGIRPRDELAAACGLATGVRGGIVVDEFLRTDDPAIYAIGECALLHGRIYGLVIPGYEMAGRLAGTLAGKPRRFQHRDYPTRLKVAGLEVSTIGDNLGQGTAITVGGAGAGAFREFLIGGDRRLTGATLVGPCATLAAIQSDIERRRRLRPGQIERLRATGTIWDASREDFPISQWPASSTVCNCRSVSAGTLRQARAAGCDTVAGLQAKTGAGTVCGSCVPHLARLCGAAPASPVRPIFLWALLAISALALALDIAVAFLPPIPLATSVQAAGLPTFLFTDGFAKQISGYTLIGIALLSLVLSLRKRLPVLRNLWDYQGWRCFHAVLGTLCLIGAVAHTGFRLGDNFNRILMLSFLALVLLGSLAGAVTALERRLPAATGARLRFLWTSAHIVLFWPIPVLTLFHVLTIYYY